MKYLFYIALLALGIGTTVVADHDDGAPWSWHVVSGGLDESRVALYRQRELIGIFNFSCDLTELDKEPTDDNGVSMELVKPDSHPRGLLLLRCNVGAHSQHMAVIDPARKSDHVVLTRTGSYFVSWEIQDGELWISYDRSCGTGPSVDCPDGFETLFERYPESKEVN